MDKEEEKLSWEARLEEYCVSREEAVEILKHAGADFKVDLKK